MTESEGAILTLMTNGKFNIIALIRIIRKKAEPATPSPQGVFQIFNKSFTHESRTTKYLVLVGGSFPNDNTGNVGDICVNSSHLDEVVQTLNACNLNIKIEKPENHDKHQIYYKSGKGWTCAEEGRDGGGRPYTSHPILSSSHVLDDYAFRWRSVRSYYQSTRKREATAQGD
jgi:hypothetical protein